MSGMPGRSGRRRQPVEHHIAMGSYRPGKHGPRPAVGLVAAWPQAADPPPAWTPDAAALAALGDAGRAFLVGMLDENTVDRAQGMLLLEAARVLDDLEVWRASAAVDKTAARMANTYTRTFASLLVQVRQVRLR